MEKRFKYSKEKELIEWLTHYLKNNDSIYFVDAHDFLKLESYWSNTKEFIDVLNRYIKCKCEENGTEPSTLFPLTKNTFCSFVDLRELFEKIFRHVNILTFEYSFHHTDDHTEAMCFDQSNCFLFIDHYISEGKNYKKDDYKKDNSYMRFYSSKINLKHILSINGMCQPFSDDIEEKIKSLDHETIFKIVARHIVYVGVNTAVYVDNKNIKYARLDDNEYERAEAAFNHCLHVLKLENIKKEDLK